MADLQGVLIEHAARYPKMLSQDAVKLVYQNEFGGGHIIADAEASLGYLAEELRRVGQGGGPLCEDIGNGVCRLPLRAAAREGVSPALINRMFIASAGLIKGNSDSFVEKLGALTSLARAGALPFSASALDAYLEGYAREGYPLVRHSEPFRATYRPAYRVVLSQYAAFIRFFQAIDALLEKNRRAVVAIDGRCASGKTTLSNLTAQLYSCNVIRMDDFFLPFDMRTDTRLAEPGGNVHYERFADEVATKLSGGALFEYRAYDCSAGDYVPAPIRVEPKELTIIEGSYSLHPRFAGNYDLKAFLTCAPDVQRDRILARNGPAMLERFVCEWIPMEESYFSAYKIPESCDMTFGSE